jgi:hypothetical protein
MRRRRRRSLDLTRPDRYVFTRIWVMFDGDDLEAVIQQGSYEQDRRDGDLMFALQEARESCDRQGVLHCILAGRHTALEGWDPDDRSLVDLGLEMRIPKLPARYRRGG